MHELSTDQKLEMMLPFLVKAQLISATPPPAVVETVRKVIEASGDRLKVAGDILGYADFFLLHPPPMDEAAVKQRLAKPGVRDLLEQLAALISRLPTFEPASLEEAFKQFVVESGVKTGDIVHAVRVAITGKTVGPGLYDCLAILGRDESLARLQRALPLCG